MRKKIAIIIGSLLSLIIVVLSALVIKSGKLLKIDISLVDNTSKISDSLNSNKGITEKSLTQKSISSETVDNCVNEESEETTTTTFTENSLISSTTKPQYSNDSITTTEKKLYSSTIVPSTSINTKTTKGSTSSKTILDGYDMSTPSIPKLVKPTPIPKDHVPEARYETKERSNGSSVVKLYEDEQLVEVWSYDKYNNLTLDTTYVNDSQGRQIYALSKDAYGNPSIERFTEYNQNGSIAKDINVNYEYRKPSYYSIEEFDSNGVKTKGTGIDLTDGGFIISDFQNGDVYLMRIKNGDGTYKIIKCNNDKSVRTTEYDSQGNALRAYTTYEN